MKNLILSCLVLVGVVCVLLSCSTKHISQEEITAFIEDFEKKAKYLNQRLAEIQWDIYCQSQPSGNLDDSLHFYQDAYNDLTGEVRQLSIIKEYLSLVKDNAAKRKLELIYMHCRRGVIRNNNAISTLAGSYVSAHKEFQPEYEGQRYSREQLESMMRGESNRDRRRDMYAALMAFGGNYSEEAALIARKRNHMISQMGYNSFYDFMLPAEGINRADLTNLLEELDGLSADIYRRALDSLKNSLGVNELRIWDIGYAFHEIDQQAAEYYGADRQKAVLTSTLGGMGFRLSAFPIYFKAIEAERHLNTAEILTAHIPDDIRVPIRLTDGINSLETYFAQAGLALYAVHIDPQDHLLMQPPAPCFRDGLARTISILTESSAWKRKYAGMPEPLVIETARQREFMKLYNLRLALVNVHFEQMMYADPFADLCRVYAGLFEKYMMFPLDDFCPWAADVRYIYSPVQMQNTLIAGCIAAQTFHYLEEKYGSVLDNQHTREFLVQNYYRFGSRDDWQTLLSRGTGERLSGKYYLDYPSD